LQLNRIETRIVNRCGLQIRARDKGGNNTQVIYSPGD
jgi:hypothetical protein